MKKTIFILSLIIIIFQISAQELVNISSSPKTVPPGKKWVLKIDDEVLTDLSDLSLRDGNLCNVQLRSNPRAIGSIIEGEIGRPNKIFSLELKDLIKVPYTSLATYKLIVSNIHSNVNHERKTIRQIIFYPGERVYATLCIENIQFFEMNLSSAEKIRLEQKLKLEEDKTSQSGLNAKGDEGEPTGTIDGRAVMGEGSDKGSNAGAGYSLDLEGWDFASKPNINDRVSTQNGLMVFKITIDDSGRVVQAVPLKHNVSNDVLAYYRQVVNQISFKKQVGEAADFSTGKITFIVNVD